MRLSEAVDSHANEKDDKVALNVRGHAPVNDRSHERSPGKARIAARVVI
jgi:hypothetical protein